MKRSRSQKTNDRHEPFWKRLDELALSYPEIRDRGANIRKLQRQLRSVVDERAWQVYLELEAEINDRDALLLELLNKILDENSRGKQRVASSEIA